MALIIIKYGNFDVQIKNGSLWNFSILMIYPAAR